MLKASWRGVGRMDEDTTKKSNLQHKIVSNFDIFYRMKCRKVCNIISTRILVYQFQHDCIIKDKMYFLKISQNKTMYNIFKMYALHEN